MPETSKTLTQQQFHDKLAVFLTDGPHMLEAHNALQFHDAEQREELRRTKAALEIAEKAIRDARCGWPGCWGGGIAAGGSDENPDRHPHLPTCRNSIIIARIERAKETGQ